MDSGVDLWKFHLEYDKYLKGWRILRRNVIGQGWEVCSFRTLPAAQYALAALRFAAAIDGTAIDGPEETLRPAVSGQDR